MVLSIALIALGLGSTVFALFGIVTQSDYAANSINATEHTIPADSGETSKLAPSNNTVQVKPDPTLYPSNPKEGDKIGILKMPALKLNLSIYEGTSAKTLKKGVGHYKDSVFPGVKDNAVLSGHRDTVFRQIGKLKKGDLLIIENASGSFTYEIKGTRIVHADDRTVIVPKDHGVLTLTTCYPFNFIGKAPDRYIVSADLIKSDAVVK